MSAPLRIGRQSVGPSFRAAVDPGPANLSNEAKEYLGRLVKMVPAEVITFYTMGAGVIGKDSAGGLAGWAALSLALLFCTRVFGTSDFKAAKSPQWIAIFWSALAFVLWLYTIGGPFEAYCVHHPKIGSLAVFCWAAFVPFFYRGDG